MKNFKAFLCLVLILQSLVREKIRTLKSSTTWPWWVYIFFRVIQSLVYLLWEKCHSNLIFVLVSVTYKEKLQKIKIKKKFTFRKITSTTKFSFLRLFDDALNTLLSYLGKTILYLGITYLLRIAQCTSLDIHIEKNNSILLLLVIEKLY